jgi:hypothetical protein
MAFEIVEKIPTGNLRLVDDYPGVLFPHWEQEFYVVDNSGMSGYLWFRWS